MAKKLQQSFKRVEKKYLLTPQQYDALLDGMTPYMKADEYGRYTICNIYYDTDNFQLIRTSLEKPVYKEKLRLRSYGTPTDEQKVFVEIKIPGTAPLWLSHLLSAVQAFPASFSKYGTCYTQHLCAQAVPAVAAQVRSNVRYPSNYQKEALFSA